MKEIKPTWGEELYKKWLLEMGWKEDATTQELRTIFTTWHGEKFNGEFVDLRQNEEYQDGADIDFAQVKLKIKTVHHWIDQDGKTHGFQVSGLYGYTVDIKDSPTAYGTNKKGNGVYLNIQIETINMESLYNQNTYHTVRYRGKDYQIRDGIGWWNKNQDGNATSYIWILPIYGYDGTRTHITAKKRAREADFKKWKEETDENGVSKRLPTDRFITELPTGIMLVTPRKLLEHIIEEKKMKQRRHKKSEDGSNDHYYSYDIPVSIFEEIAVNRQEWEEDLTPALPIVRFLTPNDPWESVNYPDKEHYSDCEIMLEKYRYYVPRDLFYDVYGFDNTDIPGSIETEEWIYVPRISEIYPKDAPPIYGRDNKKVNKDGSLRMLTRVPMQHFIVWPAPGTKYQPDGQPF